MHNVEAVAEAAVPLKLPEGPVIARLADCMSTPLKDDGVLHVAKREWGLDHVGAALAPLLLHLLRLRNLFILDLFGMVESLELFKFPKVTSCHFPKDRRKRTGKVG